MHYRSSRNIFILTITVLATLAWIVPSSASANGKWHLRAFGVWVDPELDFRTTNDDGDDIRAGTDSTFGLGISGEYRFSQRFGVELGIFRVNPNVNLHYQFNLLPLSFETSDDLAMTPIGLGLNIHLLPPDKRVDLYVAPLFAYVRYSDLSFEVSETLEVAGMPILIEDTLEVSVDNDVAYGAALGIDVPISFSPWAISGTVRYLWTDLDVTEPEGDRETMGYNTLVATLGIRYSF